MNYINNKDMKRLFLPVIALFLLSACSNKKPAPAQTATAAADSAATDTVATDSDTTVDGMTSATSKPNEILFNGTFALAPRQHATVSITMGGVVKNTRLLPGQYVSRNSVIASIENPDFITLQQTYLDSYAQLEYLQAEYARQKTLSSQQAASQKKFQQSKADYLSMKSRLMGTATQLNLLGVSPKTLLSRGIQPLLYVKAPISGYVSNVMMNIGKYIHAGDELCEIIDKSSPMLCLTTYEKDIVHMKVGKTVEFRVNGMGDRTFEATIVSVGQNVDEVNRSLKVYARVKASNTQFRPGMYVMARLIK
jgi:cobalt-zinc-cadmium efflux system membrane fusion protein